MRRIAVLAAMATLGCPKPAVSVPDAGVVVNQPVAPGVHVIERIQYNDTTDIFRVFVVGRARVDEPERFTNLRLAHISDSDAAGGKKPYLQNDGHGPVAWITTNFSLGAIHGFIEQQADPTTHKNANVLTHSEKRWWLPFAAPKKTTSGGDSFAIPAYYYPPPFQDVGPLVGVGGTGVTREAAAESYRQANGEMPQAVRLAIEGYTISEMTRSLQLADAGVVVKPKYTYPTMQPPVPVPPRPPAPPAKPKKKKKGH